MNIVDVFGNPYRTLAGPDTIARSAIVVNHDSDYVYCDRQCAEIWLEENV